jgi:hypothetical protein
VQTAAPKSKVELRAALVDTSNSRGGGSGAMLSVRASDDVSYATPSFVKSIALKYECNIGTNLPSLAEPSEAVVPESSARSPDV